MGMVCLNVFRLKVPEKLYLRPNSVYCAAVTRSCNTSRCASMGLFFHPSMRHKRIRARDDIAGDNNFITGKIKNSMEYAAEFAKCRPNLLLCLQKKQYFA